MKQREIKKELSMRFNAWLESIPNEELRKEVKNGTFISGGSIASLLMGQPINDIDIFFKDTQTAVKLSEHYINRIRADLDERVFVIPPDPLKPVKHSFQSVGAGQGIKIEEPGVYLDHNRLISGDNEFTEDVQGYDDVEIGFYVNRKSKGVEIQIENAYLPGLGTSEKFYLYHPKKKITSKNSYTPLVITPNALTLTDDIQLILRYTGTPDEVHETFDFTHCLNYWDPKDNSLVLRGESLESIVTGELEVHATIYPITSFLRLSKMHKKGFVISQKEMMKLIFAVNALDLSDETVLKDNLRGLYNLDVGVLAEKIQGKTSEEVLKILLESLEE